MKKFINLFLILCLTFEVMAQDKTAIKFAKTLTPKDLKTHLTILASDEYEGRETGKKGQKMAAKYIASKFEKLGLAPPVENSYFQSFELIESIINSVYFRKGKNKKIGFEDFIYYSRSETSGEEYINTIVVNPEDSLSLKKDYKNTYVIFITEKLGSLQEKIDQVKSKGAAGFIIAVTDDNEFNTTLERFAPYFKRPSLSIEGRNNESDKMIIVNKSMLSWIYDKPFEEIDEGDKSTIIFNADYLDSPLQTENVLGFLKGKEKPNELLVITSHYDHVGIIDGEIHNGADDDGSGTATILELAEAFTIAAKRKKGPKRSILFMTVTGEEKGLLGSQYYTDFDPIFPLENTVANLNIDMVGRVDEQHENNPNYIYLIGSDKLSQELHDLSENVNKIYTKLELDYTYNDENDPNRFYYRSDHYNFAKNDIPIIFYFNGTHPDYHKPTDTVEKINFEKMSKIAKLVFHTAWEIANREERLALKN